MKQGSLRLALESVSPADEDFKVAQEIKRILFPSDFDSLLRFDKQIMQKKHRWSVYRESGLSAVS